MTRRGLGRRGGKALGRRSGGKSLTAAVVDGVRRVGAEGWAWRRRVGCRHSCDRLSRAGGAAVVRDEVAKVGGCSYWEDEAALSGRD